MLACFAKPSAPLDRLVDLFWALETPRREAGLERVLPSGTTELVFDAATLLFVTGSTDLSTAIDPRLDDG